MDLDTRLLDIDGATTIAVTDLLSVLKDLSYQPRYWEQVMELAGSAEGPRSAPALRAVLQ